MWLLNSSCNKQQLCGGHLRGADGHFWSGEKEEWCKPSLDWPFDQWLELSWVPNPPPKRAAAVALFNLGLLSTLSRPRPAERPSDEAIFLKFPSFEVTDVTIEQQLQQAAAMRWPPSRRRWAFLIRRERGVMIYMQIWSQMIAINTFWPVGCCDRLQKRFFEFASWIQKPLTNRSNQACV